MRYLQIADQSADSDLFVGAALPEGEEGRAEYGVRLCFHVENDMVMGIDIAYDGNITW